MTGVEITLERKCKDEAERYKCQLIKVEKRRSWPDRQLIAPNGWMVWMEFKKPGEEPTPFQNYTHNQLRDMNFKVFTIDSFSVFQTVLQFLLILPLKDFSLPSGFPLITKNEVQCG